MAALCLAGCATPGPLHVYTLAENDRTHVQDHGNGITASAPSFLATDETLTGFAYDPFTDHFFLRLSPGNRIRVVDRPARAIKRELEIEGMSAAGGGDLAVRPRDGHLFALHPTEPAIFETTRLGRLVRTIRLDGVARVAQGIAYDAAADRLLVLHADGRRITCHTTDGRLRDEPVTLERTVAGSLAYDADRREFYAPLAGAGQSGVFDVSGKWLRPAEPVGSFIDVGVRSLIRVF